MNAKDWTKQIFTTIGQICSIVGIYVSCQWHPTPVLLPGKSHGRRSLVGCSPWGREESDMTEWLHFHFHFHFHFHALEKEMATHSSVLAWRIPVMGEPGGSPSMGSHRVGHDWSDLAAALSIFKMFKPSVTLLLGVYQGHNPKCGTKFTDTSLWP